MKPYSFTLSVKGETKAKPLGFSVLRDKSFPKIWKSQRFTFLENFPKKWKMVGAEGLEWKNCKKGIFFVVENASILRLNAFK